MGEDDRGVPQDREQPRQPEAYPGAVMAPPPPPPAPPATAEQPPEGPRRGGLVAGLVLVAIGLLLLAQQFFPQVDIGRLWPLILIIIGISIIFRRR